MLGGLVTVIRVPELAVIVPAAPPKRTTAEWARPVMVTSCLPDLTSHLLLRV
jgi:hypothetical protein